MRQPFLSVRRDIFRKKKTFSKSGKRLFASIGKHRFFTEILLSGRARFETESELLLSGCFFICRFSRYRMCLFPFSLFCLFFCRQNIFIFSVRKIQGENRKQQDEKDIKPFLLSEPHGAAEKRKNPENIKQQAARISEAVCQDSVSREQEKSLQRPEDDVYPKQPYIRIQPVKKICAVKGDK